MIKILLKYRFVASICIFIIWFFYSGQIHIQSIIQLSNVEGDSYDEYSNLVPNYYDENGCPNVPIAYSGMTGRLGKEWIFFERLTERESRNSCWKQHPNSHVLVELSTEDVLCFKPKE